MAQYQREQMRQAQAAERARMQVVRDAERARRAYERARATEDKEQKRLYLEARVAEVEARNVELDKFVEQLDQLLGATLDLDDFLDFDALKATPEIPPFQPGIVATAEPAVERDGFMPAPLNAMQRLVPGAKGKHERLVAEAEAAYERAVRERSKREQDRQAALAEARLGHDELAAKLISRAEAQNAEIDAFRMRFEAGEAADVVEYFSLVLDASRYPAGFPRHHKMAFVPESKQLVIEYELPSVTIIPTARQYRYVRARDAIEESSRPATQTRSLYASIVAQVTLRTIHEVFEADRTNKLETIVFNG